MTFVLVCCCWKIGLTFIWLYFILITNLFTYIFKTIILLLVFFTLSSNTPPTMMYWWLYPPMMEDLINPSPSNMTGSTHEIISDYAPEIIQWKAALFHSHLVVLWQAAKCCVEYKSAKADTRYSPFSNLHTGRYTFMWKQCKRNRKPQLLGDICAHLQSATRGHIT